MEGWDWKEKSIQQKWLGENKKKEIRIKIEKQINWAVKLKRKIS
jgi:hypothetical protein